MVATVIFELDGPFPATVIEGLHVKCQLIESPHIGQAVLLAHPLGYPDEELVVHSMFSRVCFRQGKGDYGSLTNIPL